MQLIKGDTNIHKNTNQGMLTPAEVKELIINSLDSGKADDIVTIPLTDHSALADYMIIASGTSSRHVNALGSNLKEILHANSITDINTEGFEQSDWVVIDAGDVIIHLFRPEVRDFYSIEKMWVANPTFDVVSDQIQA